MFTVDREALRSHNSQVMSVLLILVMRMAKRTIAMITELSTHSQVCVHGQKGSFRMKAHLQSTKEENCNHTEFLLF